MERQKDRRREAVIVDVEGLVSQEHLLEEITHFATVIYAFCNHFPLELSKEIFAHILNNALSNRMLGLNVMFIDSTLRHILAHPQSCHLFLAISCSLAQTLPGGCFCGQ